MIYRSKYCVANFKMNSLFLGMNLITWIIGGMSLFAGIIGISNIMLVVVLYLK